jgi:hypothetical protein
MSTPMTEMAKSSPALLEENVYDEIIAQLVRCIAGLA